MQAVAAKLFGTSASEFWQMTFKEYNAAVKAWYDINDADGSMRSKAQAHMKKTSQEAYDELDEFWNKMPETLP